MRPLGRYNRCVLIYTKIYHIPGYVPWHSHLVVPSRWSVLVLDDTLSTFALPNFAHTIFVSSPLCPWNTEDKMVMGMFVFRESSLLVPLKNTGRNEAFRIPLMTILRRSESTSSSTSRFHFGLVAGTGITWFNLLVFIPLITSSGG